MKTIIFFLGLFLIVNFSFGQVQKTTTSMAINIHKTPKNAVEMQEDRPCTYRPAEPKPERPLTPPALITNANIKKPIAGKELVINNDKRR